MPLACLCSFAGSFFPTHHPFLLFLLSSPLLIFLFFFVGFSSGLPVFPLPWNVCSRQDLQSCRLRWSLTPMSSCTCIFGHHCQMHGSFQIPTPSCAWLSIPWRSRSRSEVPAIIVLSSCSPPPLRVTVRLVNKPVRLRGSPRIYKGVLVIC